MTPDLNRLQWGALAAVACAPPPGHAAHPRNATLVALQRRGLVDALPDRTRRTGARWVATEAGHSALAERPR